jgi:hypothetical protein
MEEYQNESAGDRLLLALQAAQLPEAVRAAWSAEPPRPDLGQFWRASHDQVARFVLVVGIDGDAVDVAPVTLDIERTTDDALLLEADDSDLDVPLAVWLPLRRSVARHLLDRYTGNLHMAVDAVRKSPTGRPVVSVLEASAMERAVLEDDMDELAAAGASAPSLAELISEIPLSDLQHLGFPTPLILQLRRGLRAVTDDEAGRLAPLAGVSPAALLEANPPLPQELVRSLDSPAGRELIAEFKRSVGPDQYQDARRAVGYGAFALAARETDRGDIDWLARIRRYVQAVLGGS